MKLTESIRISWRAITGHKLRSTLTTLGVIIGVGAVIVFMVLGGGFEQNIVGDLGEDEEPIITVQTQTEPEGGFGVQFVESPIYTRSDVQAIENIDGVEFVSPDGSLSAVQLTYENRTVTGGSGFSGAFGVEATTGDRFTGSLWEMVEGEPFEKDNETVIDEPTAELLGNINLGDEITIRFEDGRKTTFTVSGVVDDDTGGPNPPTMYVPLDAHYTTSIETPNGAEELSFSRMTIRAESVEQVEAVQESVSEYLKTESDAQQLKENEHRIVVQTVEDVAGQIADIIDQFALFLGGVAGISLLVGSIGIANIMIVSVTERTREIGIMKAIGARKRDIVQLFLVESLILGIIGATLGVLVGLGFGYLGVTLAGWPMTYPLDWIVVAVFVGVVVGVVSGLYPAWRAAKIDPIEALRHE